MFVVTVNNDDELRRRTADEREKAYGKYIGKSRLKAEDMHCKGCWSETSAFVGCANCDIRKCCRKKRFRTCAVCGEFEACGMLNGFFSVPAHKKAKDNLCAVRRDR